MVKDTVSVIKTPEIEFMCTKEDFGIIPPPYPSIETLPDWYKVIPPKLEKGKAWNNSTIKRCDPVLDAFSAGYIIPLAADVWIKTNGDASVLEYDSNYRVNYDGDRRMVSNHGKQQITNDKSPNPLAKYPPFKFHNYWLIKTPPEYCLLFTPPLNRFEKRFTCFSGIVDYPYYQYEYINFPFVFHEENFCEVLEAGTPLVQVIPIRKDSLLKNYAVREMTDEDIENQKEIRRKRSHNESVYKDKIHVKI